MNVQNQPVPQLFGQSLEGTFVERKAAALARRLNGPRGTTTRIVGGNLANSAKGRTAEPRQRRRMTQPLLLLTRSQRLSESCWGLESGTWLPLDSNGK